MVAVEAHEEVAGADAQEGRRAGPGQVVVIWLTKKTKCW